MAIREWEDMTPEGPGRPPIGPMVNVRLPEELIAKLDKHAADYGISRAEVIRLLLTIEVEEGGSYSTRILERILGKESTEQRRQTLRKNQGKSS